MHLSSEHNSRTRPEESGSPMHAQPLHSNSLRHVAKPALSETQAYSFLLQTMPHMHGLCCICKDKKLAAACMFFLQTWLKQRLRSWVRPNWLARTRIQLQRQLSVHDCYFMCIKFTEQNPCVEIVHPALIHHLQVLWHVSLRVGICNTAFHYYI